MPDTYTENLQLVLPEVGASRDSWEKLWSPTPLPGFTDVFALVKKKLLRIEGDLHPFMSNLLYFKGVLAAGKAAA